MNDYPKIARWYNDNDAAISLRFDDSLGSHVNTVIPFLNQYDFKVTFLVNPGRKHYKKYKDFWEKEVPQMGHSLGNHTMHHTGAKTLEEADYEIGEASKTIWALYPGYSKLLVFASGGSRKWGGKRWENTSKEYKGLVEKYYLIDLYDGAHPSIDVNSKVNSQQFVKFVDEAIEEKRHQAFHFHGVGSPDIKDILRKLIYGYGITISKDKFSRFIKYVDSVRKQVWVSPLIQILKYEGEYKSAKIKIIEEKEKFQKIKLNISTDRTLYDQELTLVIPVTNSDRIEKVLQNQEQVQGALRKSSAMIFNIQPINSEISIYYN